MEKENVVIENMIYEVRGVQVMLSSDVAKLYKVDTKEFCFQLNIKEID